MRPTIFKELLQKYSSGKTRAGQTKLVEDWYESFGEEFPEIGSTQKKLLRNELHTRIRNRLFPEEVQKIKPPHKFLLFKMAAAAAILVIVSVGTWFFAQQQVPTSLEDDKQWVEITAEEGRLKKVQLPDSTTIWLNAGSKLGFYSPFGHTGNRQVTLENGEAFFEVTPNAERPFIVISGALSTRVLGTSFTIKSYTELDEMQVSVITGTVEVFQRDSLNLGILHKGEQLTYHRSTQQTAIRQAATEESNSWLTGKIYLRQASFNELSVAMLHSFGLKLRAGSETVSTQRYTLQLRRELPVDDLLKVICRIHDNQYRKEGDVITIF